MPETSSSVRVAVIAARWHAELVDKAVASFGRRLHEITDAEIDEYTVPGAFEIPLHAQRLARSGRYDAVAACALVVDGGVYRHEFVAEAVVTGLMQVQLTTDLPVFSAVLTPHHYHEHADHHAFFSAHLETKGAELADTLAATVAGLAALPPQR